MQIKLAERVKKLPPYIFVELEKTINEKKRQGIDLISLSIGDPDIPPPKFILEALAEEASNPNNHGYSFSQGEPEFKEAVAEWYKGRFRVDLDPRREVIALIGSKEGLANIARAFVNPRDKVLVPNPAYPVYANGAVILSEGIPVTMPLLEENDFKPNIESLIEMDLKNVKMIFLNYPNNPTGSVMDKRGLKQIVDFALENNIIICYDNAYSEITFNGYKAPSILEVDGGKEVAVEFHSCSKTFSMTGDRIGFAVGNKEIIDGLLKIKAQVDSGPPKYIQKVAARALRSYINGEPPPPVKKTVATYSERVKELTNRLRHIGLECKEPLATFYVWAKCGGNSVKFVQRLLEVGVIATPGMGFGEYGEGYVRFSATQPLEMIKEACERMEKIL